MRRWMMDWGRERRGKGRREWSVGGSNSNPATASSSSAPQRKHVCDARKGGAARPAWADGLMG